jgi:hypothetical protein
MFIRCGVRGRSVTPTGAELAIEFVAKRSRGIASASDRLVAKALVSSHASLRRKQSSADAPADARLSIGATCPALTLPFTR